MWLEFGLLASGVLVAVLTARHLQQLSAALDLYASVQRRQQLRSAEARRLQERRDQMELVARVARTAAGTMLDDGSRAAREVHREIANVPFEILESIPATRDTTKVVRGVHDVIADGSYGAAGLIGKVLKGKKAKPAKPPSPPAPDDDH